MNITELASAVQNALTNLNANVTITVQITPQAPMTNYAGERITGSEEVAGPSPTMEESNEVMTPSEEVQALPRHEVIPHSHIEFLKELRSMTSGRFTTRTFGAVQKALALSDADFEEAHTALVAKGLVQVISRSQAYLALTNDGHIFLDELATHQPQAEEEVAVAAIDPLSPEQRATLSGLQQLLAASSKHTMRTAEAVSAHTRVPLADTVNALEHLTAIEFVNKFERSKTYYAVTQKGILSASEEGEVGVSNLADIVVKAIYQLTIGTARFSRRTANAIAGHVASHGATAEQVMEVLNSLRDDDMVRESLPNNRSSATMYALTQKGISRYEELSQVVIASNNAQGMFVIVSQSGKPNSSGGFECADTEVYNQLEDAHNAAASDDVVYQLAQIDDGDGEYYVNVYGGTSVTVGRTVHASPERANYYATAGKDTTVFELRAL